MAYKDPLDPRNRAARRKHYHANKEQYFARNKEKRERMREWIREVKNVPCTVCGNQYDPVAMDLHHREGEKKDGAIGKVMANGSWRQLREEVEKCDVLCAVCHRLHHHAPR